MLKCWMMSLEAQGCCPSKEMPESCSQQSTLQDSCTHVQRSVTGTSDRPDDKRHAAQYWSWSGLSDALRVTKLATCTGTSVAMYPLAKASSSPGRFGPTMAPCMACALTVFRASLRREEITAEDSLVMLIDRLAHATEQFSIRIPHPCSQSDRSDGFGPWDLDLHQTQSLVSSEWLS